MEIRNYPMAGLEVRAASETDQTNRAAGYAAVFNSLSHDLGGFREVIAPGAFTRSLADASSGALNIFALWAHNNAQPLGSTQSGKLVLNEDERGLAFELDTRRFTPAQIDSLTDGELRMSFGFIVRQDEWRKDNDGSIIRTLIDVELPEISFVINPAYPDTCAAKRSLENWEASQATEQPVKIPHPHLGELKRKALSAALQARGRV